MHPAKKKQRVGSFSRLNSLVERPVVLSEQKLACNRMECDSDGKSKGLLTDTDGKSKALTKDNLTFNDPSTADVMLFLRPYQGSSGDLTVADNESSNFSDIKLFLHRSILEQCPYFASVLSERWQGSRQFSEGPNHLKRMHINMSIPASRDVEPYFQVLKLLYANNVQDIITDVPTALSCLPVAAEWLYDDCISACVKYLEAVPWTEDEEKKVLEVVTTLQLKESAQLLARVFPVNTTAVEDMLGGLVYAATHSHPNGATVKAFVARLLSNHASRTTVKLVLDSAFANSLKIVKDSVEEYSSPNVRGRHDEIEALQRMNLHTASVNGKHLLWLVERMIDLKVADNAVTEWSDQSVFTANLQRAFNDDAWRSIAPGLPTLVLRCTSRLANAVAAGIIIASCQVRLRFVKCWLPVLLVSRDNPSNVPSALKILHQELEDVFLRIISTLPFKDAQELLPQCLSFATRSMEDCPHLVAAFDIWFRRAAMGDYLGVANNDGSS